MAQKLWEKSVQVNKDIVTLHGGRDRETDLYLAKDYGGGFDGPHHHGLKVLDCYEGKSWLFCLKVRFFPYISGRGSTWGRS